MKILIAEDEPMILMSIQKQLNNEGYETVTAADGREALLALDKNDFNLIITDILMPFTSGLELIGIIKSNPQTNIPILVLSAMGQETTVLEAFQLGADDFLTKPFNPIELTTRVKRLLNVVNK
jgi:DNA-binding response OmpR family regulator